MPPILTFALYSWSCVILFLMPGKNGANSAWHCTQTALRQIAPLSVRNLHSWAPRPRWGRRGKAGGGTGLGKGHRRPRQRTRKPRREQQQRQPEAGAGGGGQQGLPARSRAPRQPWREPAGAEPPPQPGEGPRPQPGDISCRSCGRGEPGREPVGPEGLQPGAGPALEQGAGGGGRSGREGLGGTDRSPQPQPCAPWGEEAAGNGGRQEWGKGWLGEGAVLIFFLSLFLTIRIYFNWKKNSFPGFECVLPLVVILSDLPFLSQSTKWKWK